MKLNTGVNSAFPNQMVSEEEKKSLEYGLQLVKLLSMNGLEVVE